MRNSQANAKDQSLSSLHLFTALNQSFKEEKNASKQAKITLACLRSNLANFDAVRRAKKKGLERHIEISEVDLQFFFSSPVIKKCKKLLGQKPIKKQTAVQLRNCLMRQSNIKSHSKQLKPLAILPKLLMLCPMHYLTLACALQVSLSLVKL